ncbi:MAG: hypothetical protein BWY46_02010 [Firmicutes bacterium ADurb.Bin300]|nr:MAG: hypothetical protein BWY46_02010 [Firmicutes bacterium ADurb.Bin300]
MKKIEKKRILVTVKAYPNPSKKYGETVCCAGVDLGNSQLVRLYPVPYRDLDNDQKFKKYSIIEVDCFPPNDDKRPESFRVNSDSISVVAVLDTEKGTWQKRKDIVLKVPVKSMCQVYRDAEDKDKDLSLGLIKPEGVTFEWSKQSLADQKSRESCYAQLSFFDKKKDAIEEIPFNFYYNFKCAGVADCPGHKLSIIDWEIGQAFRDWRAKYTTEKILLEKIEQRWLDIANTAKKDVYFYVGNLKRFRTTFMVLGVFYPKL